MRVYKIINEMLKNLTWRHSLRVMLTIFLMALFACFFDWLLINWLSGCCEGGVCIPEWVYPQCIVHGGSHD
jgi:hypothetical protein